MSGPSGYISSVVTTESGFGSEACPWVIRVDSGQRINITLLDFTLATTKANGYNEVSGQGRGGGGGWGWGRGRGGAGVGAGLGLGQGGVGPGGSWSGG